VTIRPFRRSKWLSALAQLTVVLTFVVIVPTAVAQNVGGTLAVQKIVVNQVDPSAPIPAVFNTTTHCSQNAASPPSHTAVNVADGQTVTQSTTMAPGINCSITEAVPPPISGLNACKGRDAIWTANYSSPVTIVAGQTVLLTVTNTLACAPPTGGSLQVYKDVVNTLGVPNPSTFAMVASCNGMAAVPLNVAPSQSVTVSNNVPGGTVCAVTETLPPPVTGVKACPSGTASWVETNPGPQTVQVAQTTAIIIRNTLTCNTTNPVKGRLRVVKTVINQVGGSVTLPTTYPMSVTCTPYGPGSQSISVPAGSVGALISVPSPSQCVVTEATLPPLTNVKGCAGGTASWTTQGSPSAPVSIPAGGVATVTIRNTLTCNTTPPPVDCPAPNQTTIGCRITVTIKRKKGAPVYSVLVSPPATTATPNIAPSTGASCVIGSNAMINQTTCWFNYLANSTTVTLTATSSTGALPAGFFWSGACAGNFMTCVLPASLTQQLVTANFP